VGSPAGAEGLPGRKRPNAGKSDAGDLPQFVQPLLAKAFNQITQSEDRPAKGIEILRANLVGRRLCRAPDYAERA
jgi:hypothetical protein